LIARKESVGQASLLALLMCERSPNQQNQDVGLRVP
jgi:hypothetical protein